ncbi:MAG: amidohydrolase family protein [Planctomycetaceae bacterium]|nr:amidohydrolase family protein [Planctomycetaceae bacterium]
MSEQLRTRIFDELESLVLIDPHTHINPHSAASTTLADIMGYHYYTELAHSAGLPREQIEEPGLDPKEKVGRLVTRLGELDNTIQVSWLIEMCREFFGFDDERITTDNWEALYDTAAEKMAAADWEDQVLSHSKLEGVFLTNDFDDPLEGFDTSRYIPCLRTDDLVFKLHEPSVRERLAKATGIEVGDAKTLRDAIGKLFDHFLSKGAKACAISLPPHFQPALGSNIPQEMHVQIRALLGDADARGELCDQVPSEFVDKQLGLLAGTHFPGLVFWTLAELCAEYYLPFDLMIGVNRGVYASGVYQGQDLYNRQTSLHQYAELFNAFPNVTFPISVLDHTANPELVSYAWIFPNVVTNGHWWYSNIPTFIETDTRSRLEAVPESKIIGYYSDMYKLEFALPKFRMYRRALAKVLAKNFCIDRGWSEQRAINLGKRVLRGNVESVFNVS